VWNNTNRAINYEFRWGDREWKQFSIQPGERRWHSWHFATLDQSHWPTPMIRYDMDGRSDIRWVTRTLEANPAPERNYWYGIRYAFTMDDNGYIIRLGRVFDDPGIRR